jgi:toxin YoeB
MEIKFKTGAIEDINYWKKSGNIKIQNRISELLHSIIISPEKGIGKPEKLKRNPTGFWSRRIDKEHRIL